VQGAQADAFTASAVVPDGVDLHTDAVLELSADFEVEIASELHEA
jgi:hypothetical protein